MPVVGAGQDPEVSVGIPTRNAGRDFGRLLSQVLSQSTEKRYEVFALDSGSTDETLSLLASHHVPVIPISRECFDWGKLREQLHETARGRIVVSLSQDAIPAALDWLDCLVKPLEDPAVGVSCGTSIPDPARGFPQFAWERNGYYYFTREIKKFVGRYGKGMSFANTAVRRSVWEQLRIEPQATGEDFGFQMKLHRAGIRIAFPTDAAVLHHHNYTVRGVFRRCRNEGLALRQMGCVYHEWDVFRDFLSLPKYVQWLREVRYGRLHSPAEWLYPMLRPIAVYVGSRFARKMIWY